MKPLRWLGFACWIFAGAVFGEEGRFFVAAPNASGEVAFDYYAPSGKLREVLLLVPGYNGNGAEMFTEVWKRFAEEERLLLLAPNFRTSLEEIQQHRGYYYPQYWSGAVLLRALDECRRKVDVSTEKMLIFGFSAGAHFAHRFALWKPARVRAFTAYSAAWWSEPQETLKSVPALILCGEKDDRYEASWDFFKRGKALGCPWVWRSYRDSDHVIEDAGVALAQAFFRHYLRDSGGGQVLLGDVQLYRYFTLEEAVELPDVTLIPLPSREVAEAWAKE